MVKEKNAKNSTKVDNKNKLKNPVTILYGPPKKLDLDSFANRHLIKDKRITSWNAGYYCMFDYQKLLYSNGQTVVYDLKNLFYTKDDFHKYIKIKTSTRKAELTDDIEDLSGNNFVISCYNYEEDEMDIVFDYVIKLIKDRESYKSAIKK